jgi:hypothetical protein
MVLAAGADGNGRDRSMFTWRDCVLVEADGFAQSKDTKMRFEVKTEEEQ